MKILLPDSLPLAPELPDDVEVVRYSTASPIPPEHRDAEAIVIWSLTSGWWRENAGLLPNLGLVQSLTAGVDAILAADFRPEALVASGVGLHDVTVAEHALALILAAARRLDVAVRAVGEHRWAAELADAQPLDNATSFTLVHGARVVVWGFGSIGTRLAGLLRALGAHVVGVARTAGEREGFEVVTTDELPRVLGDADVLVAVLPSTPETANAIDADTLALLPTKAWVVNVGRGATLDQAALADALRAGRLAGAALDVVVPEPLPADDELWDAPNLILTPHCAGGRPLGADERIAENLRRWRAGEELVQQVAR
ncbi:phosphoglycerate dehydrogenase-like enzyme [Salana multivorans]|uniref:Phosphoglycerate dehydrogenase-like enzyme n=1 Tax=Salana multivorans TaxID=120377 RepID=A0A3N2DBX5_9MICO|nr:NAD(P)-dependent oxidoreductase [Salana multivorans]ROR97202.1 phosphoglycerate dehydrogenase-like enzyme [Salana multivorans]